MYPKTQITPPAASLGRKLGVEGKKARVPSVVEDGETFLKLG